MPAFSEYGLKKLSTCDKKLQDLFLEVIKYYDCSVICGHRNEQDQNKAKSLGFSKVSWPNSKHNSNPSLAIDVVPYPIDWSDIKRFHHFAGFVMAIAATMKIDIKWGGDFNSDNNFNNDTFIDMPHFELK